MTITFEPTQEQSERLQRLLQVTGVDATEIIARALDRWLDEQESVEKQVERNLAGWTVEELKAEIEKGLNSGPATALDAEAIKKRGRERLAALQSQES